MTLQRCRESVSFPDGSIQRATNLPIDHVVLAVAVAPEAVDLAADARLLVEHAPLRAKRSPVRHGGAPRFVLDQVLVSKVGARVLVEKQLDVLWVQSCEHDPVITARRRRTR